ncbi:MAG TPA: hypothetical protein VIN70_11090 [Candidatus Limnocylindria bacterium]|jgi:hypothetical protein
MTLCPGDGATATVAYYNTGSRGWVLGRAGETAYLGTWDPSPGQDRPSVLGGNGTNGSQATGWPNFNRLAVQPASYVAPGQVAWFQFNVRAPLTPGRYSIALRPLIEGAQWMEDFGVFWNVVVLNPDGTQPPVTIGGLNFNVAEAARADVYVETTVSRADATRLAATVDRDIAAVESDFGRSFARRPVIYAFGSEPSANVGNLTIAHMNTEDAIFFAKNEGGFFDPTVGSIFLNWFQLGAFVPLTASRHELTHMLIGQLAAPTAIPAWFNEGNAVMEEFAVPGSAWLAARDRYTATSAAAATPIALLPLTDLVSQATWNKRPAPLASFEYYEAGEAARFVRQDVGINGTVTILELTRAGATFDVAFQAVTGKTPAAFAAAFPGRLKATVATYPGVVFANDTIAGPGVTYVAYGFAPSASLTVTLSAAGYIPVTATRVTDAFGVGFGYAAVTGGWPQTGTYSVSVSDGVRTVTSTTVLTNTGTGAP